MINDVHQRVANMKPQEREMLANKWNSATLNERNNWTKPYAEIMKAAADYENKRKR